MTQKLSTHTPNTIPANWHSHAFYAMGCEMAIWLETAESTTAAAAFAAAETLFAEAEQTFSRFRPDSELSRVNASTGQWVELSDLFWEVLQLALGLAYCSDGLFDPTILPALEKAGYTQSFSGTATAVPPALQPLINGAAILPPAWSDIRLDDAHRAVYLPTGVRLDLGGIVKGHTAQRAADLLNQWGPNVVDAGGDLAAGTAPSGYPGWPAAITTPWSAANPEPEPLFAVWLATGGLATSGIDYRRWQQNGRLAHHLIDPHTQAPAATDLLTATVMAPSAVEAEGWATAILVAGARTGTELLQNLELPACLITQDGRILVTSSFSSQIYADYTHNYPVITIGA